ncbi:MAG TPA: 1,4-dihydroxy-6-naphthoate synthase [Gammaproteobacteria bacterium]|mgnify:CR=1 FL=1|nr:1,4-dihydroxy-6-naphthoate synthase [Gammaproteobacteria bacterium]
MSARPTLRFGCTPCPNDTWMVGAVATGRLALPAVDLALELADIEALNEGALARRYDIVKVSCALVGALADDYALLEVGAAIADGYGPLILTREPQSRDALTTLRVLAPGVHTTGSALARLYAPGVALVHRRYDAIVSALRAGEFEAGIVIHEGRLTFDAYGLHCLVDLGAWWTATTGLPVALGCYLIRRELAARYAAPVEALMRASLAMAARGDDPAIAGFVRRHAQELAPQVLRDYIALYVNARTHALGSDGRAAVLALGQRLAALAA